MSQNQDKIDSLVVLGQKILAEVQALKAQPGAEVLDFTKLDAVLGQIDAENPDAPAPEQTPEPALETPEAPAEPV